MKANAALKMLERVLGAAQAKGVQRATRAILFKIISEESGNQATAGRLAESKDRPWATKDLTDRSIVLGNFERLGKSGKEEVTPGEVIACFPTLKFSDEVEPVVVISMPIKDSDTAAMQRGGLRRRMMRGFRGEEAIPGLRVGEDGYYLDKVDLMMNIGEAFAVATEEMAASRLGLASFFLSLGYRVLILLPTSLAGESRTFPLAVDGARSLEANGAITLTTSNVAVAFEWPRDKFTQFEGQVLVSPTDKELFAKIQAHLGINMRVKFSERAEGGRVLEVGDHLVFGKILGGNEDQEFLRFIAGGDGYTEQETAIGIAEMMKRVEAAPSHFLSLGVASVFPINPFWGDLFTQKQLDKWDIRKRVFVRHGHVDMPLTPASATRELGVHARFLDQNRGLVEQMAARSGYRLIKMPDRASFGGNVLPLQRGPYDLLMDENSVPERALFSPGLRVKITEGPFADVQSGIGSVRCATNILWVPRSR